MDETIKSVRLKGVHLIDREAGHGVRDDTAFIHPSSLNRIFIELVQVLSESDR